MEAFAARLKRAMEERRLSQKELCARTGIPKSAMSQYCSGIIRPKQKRTRLLAETLGVSPAWLIGFDEPLNLSDEERELILARRADPSLREAIRGLMRGYSDGDALVFRAAKSDAGDPPSLKRLEGDRLEILRQAPDTDEDL